MNTLRRILLMAVVGMVFAIGTQTTAQGKQDFIVVNRTGVEIYALYVSPHTAKDWQEDVLGADTLLPDESLLITFARKERASLWDLRIEDDEGNYIEWEKLNLLRISKVTLYYRNGKASAVVE